MATIALSAEELRDKALEVKRNAPKIGDACDAMYREFEKRMDDFPPFAGIAQKIKEMKNNSVLPMQEAFMELSKSFDEMAEETDRIANLGNNL